MPCHNAFRRYLPVVVALCSIVVLSACSTFGLRERHNASSVVDFLYPDKDRVAEKPSVPVLALPLRVGIAFVPPTTHGYRSRDTLTEEQKMALLQRVADHFKRYPYVKDIELIPSAYLRPRGSFANLDQIRTLHGIDVIALVSYDQVQFTDQGLLSLTYWTIVGAYIIPGEKNDTHTMLDTVVFDIPSRKMLFRAPGTNHVKGHATLVNLTEQLRKDSEAGFDAAANDMIANLDVQLAAFKDRVKERPEEYKVVRTSGYKGGGSIDEWMLLFLALLAGGFAWTRRHA